MAGPSAIITYLLQQCLRLLLLGVFFPLTIGAPAGTSSQPILQVATNNPPISTNGNHTSLVQLPPISPLNNKTLANPLRWDSALCKGEQIHAALQSTSSIPPSKFQDFSIFEEQGWTGHEMTLGDENTVKWIDTMLKALTVENKKFTRVDLQRRDDTLQLRYENFISTSSGLIISYANYNHKSDPAKTPDQISRRSDVQYLQWKETCSRQKVPINSLKYVVHYSVSNQGTIDIVNETLKKRGVKGLPEWPGEVYEAGSEGFNALLGAPNHYGDGFMLMQHQDSLGHKEIESITVFDNDVGGTLTTLVRIKDVAPVSSKKGSSNGRVKL